MSLKWTEEDKKILVEMYCNNCSAKEMAEKFNRSEISINSYIYNLRKKGICEKRKANASKKYKKHTSFKDKYNSLKIQYNELMKKYESITELNCKQRDEIVKLTHDLNAQSQQMNNVNAVLDLSVKEMLNHAFRSINSSESLTYGLKFILDSNPDIKQRVLGGE